MFRANKWQICTLNSQTVRVDSALGRKKKYRWQRSLGWEMGMRKAFLLLSARKCSVEFFFFLIYAITEENCSKGRAKVQTCSEISSQEYAGKLAPKPTSLPGLQSYARWLLAFTLLLNFHMKGIHTTLNYGTLKQLCRGHFEQINSGLVCSFIMAGNKQE